MEGLELYKNYQNNEKAFIFLDPPYMLSFNGCYSREYNGNIYEYLYNNSINESKAYIVLVLEDVWIIRMIFKNNIINEYEKSYRSQKARKTSHIIISNINGGKS
jgi:site-specific DNA-adenine methylase